MDNLKRIRIVLFVVLTIGLLISLVAFIDDQVLQALPGAIRPSLGAEGAATGRLLDPTIWSALSFSWLVVVGITLVTWTRSAYAAARTDLHVRDVEHRQWAVWGWIIPVVNLYKPCQMLRELYRCGDASAGQIPLDDIPSSIGLSAWWIVQRLLKLLFLLSVFVFILSGISGISLTPFASNAVQLKWTAAVYALMMIGWMVVTGLLTARLGRHPGYAADSLPIAGDIGSGDEDDREDIGEEYETDDRAFFNAAYRREPMIGDLKAPRDEPVVASVPLLQDEPVPSRAETVPPSMASQSISPRFTAPQPAAFQTSASQASTYQPPAPQPPTSQTPGYQPLARQSIPTAPAHAPVPVIAQPETLPQDDIASGSGFDEMAAYSKIADELETGQRDKGAWLRAMVESGGDEARQAALYATLRLKQLRMAHDKERHDLAERQRIEEQERLEQERAAERRREAERYLLEGFHQQDAVTLDGPEFLEVVQVAVEENRVNQRSRSNGKTLLHMAVERIAFHSRQADDEASNAELLAYDRRAIRMLLDAGADPALRDRGSRSAHDYARAVGIPLRQLA